MSRRLTAAVALLMLVISSAAFAQAAPPAESSGQSQAPRPRARGGERRGPPVLPTDAMGPGQIDQLFDAYMLLQAQPFLRLTDDQLLLFGNKLRDLQAVRRRLLRQRGETLDSIRELTQTPGALDPAVVESKLRALDGASADSSAELRAAYAAIDRVLTPRQQLRFRLFEDQMERRKLELIALARQRQQGRGGAQGPGRRGQPSGDAPPQ